jgi:hypothetical protein
MPKKTGLNSAASDTSAGRVHSDATEWPFADSRSSDTFEDLDSESFVNGGGDSAPGSQQTSRRDDCIIKFVAEAMEVPDPLAANLLIPAR